MDEADAYELYALTIRYARRHARELEAAAPVAAAGWSRSTSTDVPLSKSAGRRSSGVGEIPRTGIVAETIPNIRPPTAGAQYRVLSLAMRLGRSARRGGDS